MTIRIPLIAILLCVGNGVVFGQEPEAAAPRLITLREALDRALEHNHLVRIARSSVDEKQHAKNVARSAYFPLVRNDSSYFRITDTQLIEIPAGGLGVVGRNLIPPEDLIINQGGLTLTTIGTGIVQPLTQLWKIKAANDVARAEVEATRGKSRGIENSVALKVHQLYYQILIGEARRSAVQAKQLTDLRMQFNDVIGLPLTTAVTLDPTVGAALESCAKEECIKLALESHPEIAEARAQVEKAASAVRLAKYDFVPDVEAFARYSYQNNVPFLAQNFGTFGVHLSYDLFDGGRKLATLRERDAQLRQAQENLARTSDEVELRVQTAYNKLERTRQMIGVSKELLALRTESRRVAVEQLDHGGALRSQAKASVAQELEAKALLLQSQLDYFQAANEMDEAIGRPPQ
jgi:outer membrane protein TolC